MAYAEKTSSGKWRGVYRDATSRKRSRTFPTQREAKRWANEQEIAISGTVTSGSRMAYRDWVSLWVHTYSLKLRPSSIYYNEMMLRNHLIPFFGTTPLEDITLMQCEQFIVHLQRKGLASESVRGIVRLLKRSLNAAVERELIPVSPAQRLRQPRKEHREVLFIPDTEVIGVGERVNLHARAHFYVLALCGLRWGESIALQPSDITSSIAVRRQAVRAPHVIVQEVKTEAANRSVPMPEFVEAAVRHHMAADPGDTIFKTITGKPFPYGSDWNRRFLQPALVGTPWAGMRVHDLRHTAISMWLSMGLNVKDCATLAGHSSTDISLSIYAHSKKDVGVDMMSRINQLR